MLTLLLQHGLDPNVRFSQRSHHILLSLMDMVQNARSPKDLNFVYSLTLTLLQYGANPNMVSSCPGGSGKGGPGSLDPRRGLRTGTGWATDKPIIKFYLIIARLLSTRISYFQTQTEILLGKSMN